MSTEQKPLTPGWYSHYWLFKLQCKRLLAQCCLRLLACCAKVPLLRLLVRQIPRLTTWLPPALLGADYRLCRQNLALWGYHDRAAARCARYYVAINLLRRMHSYQYEITDPAALRQRLQRINWVDPQQWFARSATSPCLILLSHSGEHWLSVAAIIAATEQPGHFIVPELVSDDTFKNQSLHSLQAFGHTVEGLNVNAPNAALALTRALRSGKKVLMFADLPAGIGSSRFGDPYPCRFLQRPAQFVKGPAFIAARLKLNILQIGHRVNLHGQPELHCFNWITAADGPQMHQQVVTGFEQFITASPENWLYLPRTEVFFHQQQAGAMADNTLPTALRSAEAAMD